MSDQSFRYIVRIFGQDVDGTVKVPYALAMVKGIGYNTARAIVMKLGIDKDKRFGELTESEVKKIEDVLSGHSIRDLPSWTFNRRMDYESGRDMHLVTSDLIYYVRNDIEREKKMRSWRGVRHSLGLKVRGQRTRTTGRSGGTVGVKRGRAGQPAASTQTQPQKK
ncbi:MULTISPECIES: 30S ribosomal protein S13 [Acidianus]|uniref:Small ribosomal subunit protein uS13 n=1 Tax=Candidatus Acidianus copahuensis TaxID=1160895 RepID=A0A031LMP5_9CREN|nr:MULTISPECIES: 30S ribosomal protein S13 [Acidianus]EZQ03160.1 30S ribosomal protein S13 [Candidatus Acidianus copahuensis]NON62226.1 30S ribosomal protein S13 [Acidianus sp. RZ1]